MTKSSEQSATPKPPAYIAYSVRNDGEKGFFTKIGAAWSNRDGKGFNIHLDNFPLDGRITLRLPSEQN